MTRFELYYSCTDVDIDAVAAMRCPIPHQVKRIHGLGDEDEFCLARHDACCIDSCRRCWEQKLDADDLPEVSYVLARRYSDLGLTMIDFVHIGGIMLSNDCAFKEAISTYYDQMAEYICKEG